MTLTEHAKWTATKAERDIVSISRLMSNLGGLNEGKRKLLANIAMSVLVYEALIWTDAINTRKYPRMEMVSVQWKAALRCVGAYRTASIEAVCALAGISSIEIVTDERKRLYSATR